MNTIQEVKPVIQETCRSCDHDFVCRNCGFRVCVPFFDDKSPVCRRREKCLVCGTPTERLDIVLRLCRDCHQPLYRLTDCGAEKTGSIDGCKCVVCYLANPVSSKAVPGSTIE